mmetsp:Transcript_34296/g.66400  ORF Transcript_34296/g.66400 Transcript_34296/m.66400 type:complete len:108 (+) Transcript_34296:520-843(+)
MGKLEAKRAGKKPPTRDEVAFRKKLEQMDRELKRPTHYRGKLEELSSVVRTQDDLSGDMLSTVDDENKKNIKLFLKRQMDGLQRLTKELQKQQRHLRIIQKGISERT